MFGNPDLALRAANFGPGDQVVACPDGRSDIRDGAVQTMPAGQAP
jgi:hypothetical protein